MKYNLTVTQKDIIDKSELILFQGVVANIREFDYFEKETQIRTNVYVDNDLFELVRYGDSRTILHLEETSSFAKVIDVSGNIDLDIRLLKKEISEDKYSYEYQIMDGDLILQHFILTLCYKVLFN